MARRTPVSYTGKFTTHEMTAARCSLVGAVKWLLIKENTDLSEPETIRMCEYERREVIESKIIGRSEVIVQWFLRTRGTRGAWLVHIAHLLDTHSIVDWGAANLNTIISEALESSDSRPVSNP